MYLVGPQPEASRRFTQRNLPLWISTATLAVPSSSACQVCEPPIIVATGSPSRSASELYAAIYPDAQPGSCATQVYVRTGPDSYEPYVLQGGS